MRIEQQLLIDCLDEILNSDEGTSTKISEFELLQKLKQPPWEIFPKENYHDNLALFQYHFVLFHCLYRLQANWLDSGIGYLKISALQIQKLPLNEANLEDEAELKIRDYYLDWQHFDNTSEQDVENLLDSFWDKFGSIKSWQAPSTQEVDDAFFHFSLRSNSDWKAVKKTYLKAQSTHHPDKGGDVEQAKRNSHYFDVLKRYFRFK